MGIEVSALALGGSTFGWTSDEITSRQVRDVDDRGRLLWIPASKTPAGRRTLEVPEILRIDRL